MNSSREGEGDVVELVTDPESMVRWSESRRHSGERIAFVPTMGALHDGHVALVRAARSRADRVVVSIFVNPAQFGPREDFSRYPRTFERDRELLAAAGGCDVLFFPEAGAIYPPGFSTSVRVEPLASELCGRSRPGHFDGVAVVVTILFNLVRPHVACFGLKDYQQFQLIRRVVRDLALPVELVGVPTVREADGLAMSSRNRYLDAESRVRAVALYRALRAALLLRRAGERDPSALVAEARRVLADGGVEEVEYVEVRDAHTLLPIARVGEGDPVLLVAAKVGGARLIDNMVLTAVA